MTLLDFAAVSLAAAAAVDAWRQGSLFARWRDPIDRRAIAYEDGIVGFAWDGRRYPFFALLLRCWYCLSHWVPAILIAGCVVPGMIRPAAAPYLMLPVYSLAATKVVALLNWMTHEYDQA
jgi:hypothetical protein